MLCGYNVSKAAGFAEIERRAILLKLIETGIFKVGEIIAHLDLLIDTNGKQEKIGKPATSGRQIEILFGNQKAEQNKVLVNDIKTGSKNPKKAFPSQG